MDFDMSDQEEKYD
jgi:hypothetical protein